VLVPVLLQGVTRPSASEQCIHVWDDIRSHYRKGEIRDHQKEMYEIGNLEYRWWQKKRKEIVVGMIKHYPQASSFLDVGCAEGAYLEFARGFSIVVGCDISRPKLQRALAKQGNCVSNFVQADGSHLPFRNNSFNIVISVDVIRYVTNPFQCLSETFRVSDRHVIVQSMTQPLRLSSRPVRRSLPEVRRELREKEFSGAFWVFSPRVIERLPALAKVDDFRIVKLVGLLPLANALQLMRVKDSQFMRLTSVIERIQRKGGDKFPLRLLAIFTTAEYETLQRIHGMFSAPS
jgi:ubiquinone/menaquinone biosynthesis C-methylase UbiE